MFEIFRLATVFHNLLQSYSRDFEPNLSFSGEVFLLEEVVGHPHSPIFQKRKLELVAFLVNKTAGGYDKQFPFPASRHSA